jgi:hypothetical protein
MCVFYILAKGGLFRNQVHRRPQTCGADFQVGCLAGFKTRVPSAGSTRSNLRWAADLEIGEPNLGLAQGSETLRYGARASGFIAPTSNFAFL